MSGRFLVRKCLGDAQWPWLGCALAVFIYGWIRVWLVASFEMERFQGIVLQLWDEFSKFSPVPLSELFTYRGRIARTFTEPIIVVCVTAWGISRGSDSVSGELGRGTLEMVLAQPVGRRQLLGIHALITTAGSCALAALVWLSIVWGIATNQVRSHERPSLDVPGTGVRVPLVFLREREVVRPMSEVVEASSQLPGCVNLVCLAVFVAGLSTWLSSWDQYRWRTVGLAVAFLVVESTLHYVALAHPQWRWLDWLSIYAAYNPELHISLAATAPEEVWTWVRFDAEGKFLGPGPLGANALLLALGAMLYLAAATIFVRRDIAPPP